MARRIIRTEEKPEKSKVTEIAKSGVLKDPITLEIESDRPVAFVNNPTQIVDHDLIPEKIRLSVIQTYGETFFYSKEWNLGQLKRLYRAITTPRENLTNAVAQVCGPECNFMDICPYNIVGQPPTGDRCPVEIDLSRRLYEEYVESVSERLKLRPEDVKSDIILHNIVAGIVEADLIDRRLNSKLANDGFIDEVPTAIAEDGTVYYRDEEAVAIRIKDRVSKRRDQLYRQLVATPEMAEKYKRKGGDDVASRSLSILEQLEKKFLPDPQGQDAQIAETRED